MPCVKLFPREGTAALPVEAVVSTLEEEFEWVVADAERGRDHVAGMIAAVLRVSDALPDKQYHLERLRVAQAHAVYIIFGDQQGVAARCCILPDTELFFGATEEVAGAARQLVDRAAAALGYVVVETG